MVRIVSSKTNQFNEYVSEIPVFANKNSVLCPVAWIKRMLEIRSLEPGEQLFKLFKGGRWIPMTARWFNIKLKVNSLLKEASSHGLRRGGATYMLQNEFKLAEVKQRGQWKSSCVFEYLSLPTNQAMMRENIFSLSLP